VTANALTGFWGSKSRKAAEWLLHREAVHVVASDAHDLNLRPPLLSEARDRVAALVGEDVADALVTHNPAAIVAGQHVPFSPAHR
ncbi:MAG TPA: CpsB/CapC family capsule biosynthesis tyrosine phosphatase, partial [Terriglobales bacterium]